MVYSEQGIDLQEDLSYMTNCESSHGHFHRHGGPCLQYCLIAESEVAVRPEVAVPSEAAVRLEVGSGWVRSEVIGIVRLACMDLINLLSTSTASFPV